MRLNQIEAAKVAAQRLIELADVVIAETENNSGYIWGNKNSGALRRGSMDLTRALSEMRRP